MYDYARNTYNSPNLLRRFSHRIRIKRNVDFVLLSSALRMLDYGCHDDFLYKALLKSDYNGDWFGYEPINIQDNNKIFHNWEDIENSSLDFDLIVCFEVLEHFNKDERILHLERFANLLPSGGKLIISVPIEIGPVSLIKNGIRSRGFLNTEDYLSFKNIMSSLLYISLPEYRNRGGFLRHMGFDFRELKLQLQKDFNIKMQSFSPLCIGGHLLNSQVFWYLEKK